MAMVTLAVLALIAASTFQTVSARFRSNYQTASWHDALIAAEGGTQYALARLRSPFRITGKAVDPTTVVGSLQWDLANTSGTAASVNGTVLTETYNSSTFTRIQLPTLTIPHAGEGSSQYSALVTVDPVPAANVTSSGSSTWYRIQSVGTVPLSGGAYVGIQKYDNFLRKLRFKFDSSGNPIGTPQASRAVEIIAKPVTIGSAALFAKSGIDFTSQNILVNSYDSRSTTHSTNGKYDATKATSKANIVTNDEPTSNGNPGVINLSPTGAQIKGNIATNNTPVTGGTGNVTGNITLDFYQYLPSPPDPAVVSTSWTTIPASTTSVSTGSVSAPARYKINSTGNLSLTGNSALSITPPSSGQGYVEIWIPGDLTTSGNGAIKIPDNVHVVIYVDGNVKIAGNGIVNTAQRPANVILYGNHDSTQSQSITVDGNGQFAGVIYAPSASATVKGGGSNGDMFGSITANSISFNGTTSLHYDQALGDHGAVIDYRVASWHEDNTLTR